MIIESTELEPTPLPNVKQKACVNVIRAISPGEMVTGDGSPEDLLAQPYYPEIVFLIHNNDIDDAIRDTPECNKVWQDLGAAMERMGELYPTKDLGAINAVREQSERLRAVILGNVAAYQTKLLERLSQDADFLTKLANSVKICAALYAATVKKRCALYQSKTEAPRALFFNKDVDELTNKEKDEFFYPQAIYYLEQLRLRPTRRIFDEEGLEKYCGAGIYFDWISKQDKRLAAALSKWVSNTLKKVTWPTYRPTRHVYEWYVKHRTKNAPPASEPERSYPTTYTSHALRTTYNTLESGGDMERTAARLQAINRKNKVFKYIDEQGIGIQFNTFDDAGNAKNSCIVSISKGIADNYQTRRRLPRAARLLQFIMMLARKQTFVDGDVVPGSERMDIPYQTFLEWGFLRDKAHIKRDLVKLIPILKDLTIWIFAYRYTSGKKQVKKMDIGRTGVLCRPFFTGIGVDEREGCFTVYFNSQEAIPWKFITSHAMKLPKYIHDTQLSDRAASILRNALENVRSRLPLDMEFWNETRRTRKARVKISSTIAASTFPTIDGANGHVRDKIMKPYTDAINEINQFDGGRDVRLAILADESDPAKWYSDGVLEVTFLGLYDEFIEPQNKRTKHIEKAISKREKREAAIAAAKARNADKQK